MTVTLYNYIRSELIKKGFNEFVDNEGNLIFFEEEHQFMTKIFSYDKDISTIVNKLFTGLALDNPEYDTLFKKAFLARFLERKINRQTIDAFRMILLSTFLTNKDYINRVYADLDLYLTQTRNSESTTQNINKETNKNSTAQTNSHSSTATGTSDNREADATLPQNNVQIDVNDTVMKSANSNRIARNKNVNNDTASGKSDSLSSGETFGTANGENASEDKEYKLDELLKTKGLYENIYTIFDVKCFMQIW